MQCVLTTKVSAGRGRERDVLTVQGREGGGEGHEGWCNVFGQPRLVLAGGGEGGV